MPRALLSWAGTGDVINGLVTFIARDINLSGSDFNLTPYQNGVLLYATGSTSSGKAVDIRGTDHLLTGIIYAPQGEVEISASRVLFDGSILSNGFDWSGSDGRITFNPDLFQE